MPRTTPIHWPHLLVLVTLPAWLAATRGWSPPIVLFGWLALVFVALLAAERWRPYRRDWHPNRHALARDASVLGLNALADGAATAMLTLLALIASSADSPLPWMLQVIAGALLAEFGSYWLHRLSHGDNWLWRVHLLHHRPEQLNAGNALTAHPLNTLYDKLVRVGPMVLLGFDPFAILSVALFGLTQALATHANIAGTLGPLKHVFGSAELHRLHHSTDAREAGNFGTALPIWDQLFGTYRAAGEPRSVGVFDPHRYPGQYQLIRMLGWPFRRGGHAGRVRWG